jgi:GAF domain-containing protein/GNAT superfamily N-acetyltransferase
LKATVAHTGTATEGWLHDTLEQIVGQIRALLDVNGVAFVTVDRQRAEISPAAAWFATEEASHAFGPLLSRPYDPRRGGVTEAALEGGESLLIPCFEEWEGAAALRERLEESGFAGSWDWYRTASFISCPVRTSGGRTFGVLAISSNPPLPPLSEEDRRSVEVFARLAAIALERSELLEQEARRRREEWLLNRAQQAVSASLDLDGVYGAIIEQAAELTGATKVMLLRHDPAASELRVVAHSGFSERVARARFAVGEGMVGRVAETGVPYVSNEADRELFIPWVVKSEGVGSFMHVPITLARRLFGVLTASHDVPDRFGDGDLARLVDLAHGAAGAIANALDFQRERRIAQALTRGFVPGQPDVLAGLELGLVYEPVAHEVGGGDVFGVWTLPSGAVAILLGDVSGKGLEVAATSAMVRFFVEARAWDTERPAEVLAQTNLLVRRRLPRGGFVTAFFAVVQDGVMRYCNAGHPPPRILRAAGGEDELLGSGLPLGIEDEGGHTERELRLELGDTLFGATDGLLESRREGLFFGDAKLPELLERHGRALAPQAFAELVHTEAEAWSPRLNDDVVVLVLRRAPEVELRAERAGGPAGQALWDEYLALVRERLPGFQPTEAIFGTERVFDERGAAFLVLYERGRPVACGGLRSLGPDLAEIKRLFVTADARGRGHGRRMLAELERLAAAQGARRVRLLSTDVLVEALALYHAAGYVEVTADEVDGRRDAWLEKEL